MCAIELPEVVLENDAQLRLTADQLSHPIQHLRLDTLDIHLDDIHPWPAERFEVLV